MSLAAWFAGLGRDTAFLIRRLGYGALAWTLLAVGVGVAVATGFAVGSFVVFVLPFVLAAVAAAFVAAVVLAQWSAPLRDWLGRRPFRTFLTTVPRALGRAFTASCRAWLLATRAAARRERAQVAEHRDRAIPIAYRPLPDTSTASLATLVADPATWRDLAYLVVGPAYAGLLAFALGGMLTGAAHAFLMGGDDLLTRGPASPEPWLVLGAGAGLLLAVPIVLRLGARGATVLAGALLATGESARMRAELDEQRLRRQLAVDAAEHERRRIERDLHDGAQQRLVALGISLGLARQALPADPDAAAALIDEARTEAKTALAELRDLARGIHPAILGDRGLDAALSSLVQRSPIPVSIVVVVPRRPSPTIESAAYFVVSEALTNAIRHSRATRIHVGIHQTEDEIIVEVRDDGVGGADPGRGTGLQGLHERVGGLDGQFTFDSPEGGPTTLRATLPCA